MLLENNNLLLQLNEANEQHKDLLNAVQGLETNLKIYPMEIERYEEKKKKSVNSLRNNKRKKRK